MVLNVSKPQDRVSQTFNNKTVFITGGSGFLGKVLIEKLLRCTDVKRIYLLLRTKKGRNPNERLSDIFDNVLFSVLKEKNPNAMEKCRVISGDICEENLGISEEDREILHEQVEIIYHSAASTRFDDSLRRAIIMNTRSTKYVIDLAQRCKKLKLLMHISTAYAFPKEEILYDKIYAPPANPHVVLNAIEWINDDNCAQLTKLLLGDCPNTYTFSKACAEALIAEQIGKLPVVIVRPSVVCPTYREPFPGWCNNLQGPMGIMAGAGKGIIRTMYMKGDSYADFVPADYTINGFLLATWYYINIDQSEPVINCTASSEYNFTWEEIIEIGKHVIFNIIPLNGVVWYPGGSIKHIRWVHELCFFLYQIIPAIIIDGLLIMLRYKPVLYKLQRRIQKGNEMFEYYTTKRWNFTNRGKSVVLSLLNETEKEIFEIEPKELDLPQYFANCTRTVRRHILKESDESIPAAWRHMRVMWVVDKVVKIGLLVLIFYFFGKLWK